jgi:transposase-like protein
MDPHEFDSLLSALDGLTEEQKEQINRALAGQDDLSKVTDIIETNFLKNPVCPHCKSTIVVRWTRADGLQRFRCKNEECKKTFNCLTGTPLARLRKKGLWLCMSSALKEGLSLRKAGAKCGVSLPTAFKWRHRFLAQAAKDKPAKLEGIAEADETHFLESFKGDRNPPRPSRKRGGKAAKRGLSAEQIPVLVARDRQGRTLSAVLPDRSAYAVKVALSPVLSRENILCIDGGKALRGCLRDLHVPARVIPAGRKAHAKDPVFHIQNVNAYHSRLKQWMGRFNGVATKYLPSYLGWRRVCEGIENGHSDTAWFQVAAGRGYLNT